MRKPLLLAASLVLIAGTAFAHDPSGRPETGAFAPHVTGSQGEGTPEVHRPAPTSHDGVTAGAARMTGGADDNTITREGAPRGNLGFPRAGRVVDNQDGQPVVEHGHRPAGSS